MNRQSVCLNMIVKNEAEIIGRCLASVLPFIDAWVIVDTGSTDGTQERIRTILAGVPGELHERPWIDFAHNRTEALRLAHGRGDYLLFIDADETLDADASFEMPELNADAYWIRVRYGGCTYLRKQLVRNSGGWRYEGVVHEYITSGGPHREDHLNGLTTIPRHDGARARDPLTYRRDAELLEKALETEPDDPRSRFYLAQSYRDAAELELAIEHYERRAKMGGWPEEVWYSLYQVACLKQRLGRPWPEVMNDFFTAYQLRPDRAEPLWHLAVHYQAIHEYAIAHLFLTRAAAIPEPHPSRLFIEWTLYSFRIAVEWAVASHYVLDYKTAIETSNEVLRAGKLPAEVIDHVIRNRRFSVDASTSRGSLPRDPGRIRIVVTFRDPGPELDDCIDSVLSQTSAEWEAVFIDDGSATDHSTRVPAHDPRVAFVRQSSPKGTEACLTEQLREAGVQDYIILPCDASARFDHNAVQELRTVFSDGNCLLAYGQFRNADGARGNAEPASCEEDFRKRGVDLAAGAPAAFRAWLWEETFAPLWPRAGFDRTRFLDAELTTRAAPKAERRAASISSGDLPLISCLMVTLDRLSLAKRSIRCFADQSWPNRELVIVTDGEPQYRDALERFVTASGIEGVRFADPGNGLTLGALRNVSLASARGTIICQWDDDDANHPDRLLVQAQHMLRQDARASFMTDHLQWISENRLLCWIDWTLGGAQGEAALFPGSLMMFRDPRFRYPEDGPHARQGEDSVFLHELYTTVPVASLAGAGHLYLYEYHGRNTFSREHHLHISNFRKPAAHLVAQAAALREAAAYYAIARPVVVLGREGPVFALN
jgi:glycosyltransferase involved in cell wall biosynthesis